MQELELPDTVQVVMPSDFEEIVDVWEASVRATHHFLKEEDILLLKPLILNEYLYAVNLFCTRDEKGHISGFLGASEGKIEMLFISPASRGKGIGKTLLNYAIHKLGTNKVDVNEQNEQAIGFYKHAGFIITGRSPFDGLGKPYPLLHLELNR